MPISWNEIRHNAVAFSKEWAGASREVEDRQTYWNEFFSVFGIKRRTVASFEEPVKKLSGAWGSIDLFWPGTLLVEHKSLGQSLEKAHSQAMAYIRGLKDARRDNEIPRYIIVSDFARIVLYDLEEDVTFEVDLADLHRHVDKFAFIPGYQQHKLDAEDPINIAAVQLLGELHDTLEAGGYTGHDLERFLVRVLFCMFAEDTGLFDRNAFTDYIINHTAADGSDLGMHLARIFQVLNTPQDKRQRNLIEELAELQYVNGDLFAESLPFADFNRDMRNRLIACCRFDWSRISPAVFGSLFQSVMEPRERRQIGAHYTSERDILKLVRSLFLDDLRLEFDKVKDNKNKLKELHNKLGRLTFFDPACGCGNFLVVTYRELRLLEIEVLRILHGDQQRLDIHALSLVDVDAMYGIEINEFPARIAEVAMWLVDHQMNQRLSEAFGQYFARLPLRKSAKIVHGNALRIDWKDVLPPEKCSYVLGNPPFVGKHLMTDEQNSELAECWRNNSKAGVLDYVTAWYIKAAEYIKDQPVFCGFVSTNSICQGEQVPALWPVLFREGGITIDFAHSTFPWESEARGKAHVHVVIVGFSAVGKAAKTITDYQAKVNGDGKTEWIANVHTAVNISPYLYAGTNTVAEPRTKPLCKVPPASYGSKPVDGGGLIVEEEDRETLLESSSTARDYLRPLLCADEYLNNISRWCLWMVDANPRDWRQDKVVTARIELVKKFRLASKKAATQKLASFPSMFGEVRQPKSKFIIIPQHTSERRKYIPFGFFSPDHIVHNSCTAIPDASPFHFGVLSSRMHMAWVRVVCGRLESRYRYSVTLVYNNFPWPEAPTEKQKAAVEAKAQAVLDARAAFPDSSLADLYDPLTMPPKLAKAHAELDRAVDACYRAKAFDSDRERVEYLFALYEKLTAPLTAGLKERGRGRRKAKK